MRDRRGLLWFAAGMAVAGCLALIALYLSELTEGPGFCGSCHEMDHAVKSWRAGPHGPGGGKGAVRAGCDRCHLPADPLLRFAVKGIKGARNLALHLAGAEASDVRGSEARVYVSNCRGCHRDLPAVHRSLGEAPNCLECHRTAGHKASDPLR